jgi:hypothetical protein
MWGPINPKLKVVSPYTKNRKVYTANSIFTVPFGVNQLFLSGCAGGGGGGNGTRSSGSIPVIVQEVKQTSQNTHVSFAITVSAPTNGNTMIVCIGGSTGSNPVGSVTQTGATYTDVYNAYNSLNSLYLSYWVANNVSGAGTTITVNVNTSGDNFVAFAMEVSGLVTVSPLDQTATNTGTSSSPDSGTTSTTTVNNELWVGLLAQNTAGSSVYSAPTNGFTLQDQGGFAAAAAPVGLFTKIVSTTGTADVSAHSSSSIFWLGTMATFISTSSGSAGGGGGSGATTYLDPMIVTPMSLIPVTIGSGGPAATDGGDTSFGSFLTLKAGKHGTSASGATPGDGGDGGKITVGTGFSGAGGGAGSASSNGGSGGGYNTTGTGATSDGSNGNASVPTNSGGAGGSNTGSDGGGGGGASSLFGVGGNGGSAADNNGSNGSGYGAGGGGGSTGSVGTTSGGAGSPGILIIEW